jgi:hypothetical protein
VGKVVLCWRAAGHIVRRAAMHVTPQGPLVREETVMPGRTEWVLNATPIDLNTPGHYLNWGVIQISVANLVVIGLMVLVFVAAVLLPFPKGRGRR